MKEEILQPSDILAMPLKEFERRFGFRPKDALEKHWFAAMGSRLSQLFREAIEADVLGDMPDLTLANMEDGE